MLEARLCILALLTGLLCSSWSPEVALISLTIYGLKEIISMLYNLYLRVLHKGGRGGQLFLDLVYGHTFQTNYQQTC